MLISDEDDLAKRITPLLTAANANLGRVHLIGDHGDHDYKPLNLLDAEDVNRLGRVDKPDPNANARQQYESGEALNELVVSGGDAT